MTQETKQEIKRYLVSSFVTFVSAFSIILLANIDNITYETLYTSSTASILFTAGRGAIKAVLESTITYLRK